jgi:hypothetical protein
MSYFVRIQFKRLDAIREGMLPTIEIGVLRPVAEPPDEAGFGPCVLLLAAPDNPRERPDTDFGRWDGTAWWSTTGERVDPVVGYLRLPNKAEMDVINAEAGVDEREGRWTLTISVEAVH